MRIGKISILILIVICSFGLGTQLTKAQDNTSVQNNITNQDNAIAQIGYDETSQKNFIPYIIYANGVKKFLTLGTFTSGVLSLTTAKNEKQTIDPNTLLLIVLSKNTKGEMSPIISNMKGVEKELTLGNFFSAAVEKYSNCSINDLNGREIYLKLRFETSAKGELKAYLVSPRGKDELNLGVLLREVSLGIKKCGSAQ